MDDEVDEATDEFEDMGNDWEPFNGGRSVSSQSETSISMAVTSSLRPSTETMEGEGVTAECCAVVWFS